MNPSSVAATEYLRRLMGLASQPLALSSRPSRFDDELVTIALERAAEKISRHSHQLKAGLREQACKIGRVEIGKLEVHHVRPPRGTIGAEFFGANHRLHTLLYRVV